MRPVKRAELAEISRDVGLNLLYLPRVNERSANKIGTNFTAAFFTSSTGSVYVRYLAITRIQGGPGDGRQRMAWSRDSVG